VGSRFFLGCGLGIDFDKDLKSLSAGYEVVRRKV